MAQESEKKPLRVFLNPAEEAAYDREQRRRQEGETHGDILPFKRGEDGGIDFAVPQFLRDLYNSVTLPRDAASGYQPTEDDIAQFALDVGAGGITASSALETTAGEAATGMFLGEFAKNAPVRELIQAKEMHKEGLSREEIWKATGWWKSWDDKWRFEVSDEATQFKPEVAKMMQDAFDKEMDNSRGVDADWSISASPEVAFSGKAEHFIDAPELQGRYSNALSNHVTNANTNARLTSVENTQEGYFDPSNYYPEIGLKADSIDSLRSVFIHELQHAVQNVERHSRGSGPSAIQRVQGFVSNFILNDPDYRTRSNLLEIVNDEEASFAERMAAKINAMRLDKKLKPLDNAIAEFYSKYGGDVHYKYRSAAGEVEANLSQRRRDMTNEERRNVPPWTMVRDLGPYSVEEKDIYLTENLDRDYQELLKTVEDFKGKRGYAKGGIVEPNEQLPPGAIPSDVADDVDAKLSEGEYIIPANVVRFLGVDKLEKMVAKAQEQLQALEDNGRTGEPIEAEEEDDTLPFPEEELIGFAEGGLVDPAVASNTLPQGKGGYSGVRRYKDANGQIVYVPFFNGAPLFQLPDNYTPMSDAVTSKAPDPQENVSQYQSPSSQPVKESGADKSTTKGLESPLAGDPNKWSVEDFITYGRTNDGAGEKAARGMISMMPMGGLFFKAREKYLDKTTGELIDQMLQTGTDLQGKPITPETKQDLINTKTKLADDLSRESGLSLSPTTTVANMIDKFASFVTGKPSTPAVGQPRQGLKPSAYQAPAESGADKAAPSGWSMSQAEKNLNSSTKAESARTSGGLYAKGGLVTRRNKK